MAPALGAGGTLGCHACLSGRVVGRAGWELHAHLIITSGRHSEHIYHPIYMIYLHHTIIVIITACITLLMRARWGVERGRSLP